ncbi:MAG: NUDIX domain-containing protein [Proteobacteria bacterium]|nr:NUDIX domain-containing protein [Pseudomonadota bacterium]
MLPTDLTVSAVIEQDDRFLMIEQRTAGSVIVTHPGGHIETGEAPEQAVVRGAMEGTGCEISVSGLLGVYLWIHPQTRQQFLRIVYRADMVKENVSRQLDSGFCTVHWYSLADIRLRSGDLGSPIVLRSVEDYMAGKRQPDELLAGMMPIQQNVAAVMANAALV